MADFKLNLLADYFQFLLMDEGSDFESLAWNPEALHRLLAVGDNCVGLGTLRDETVAVQVLLLESCPTLVLSGYDNVVEASISVPSGNLVVMGCSDFLPDALHIPVRRGIYQLLSLVRGIKRAETAAAAAETYTVYLWPGRLREPRLVKHWRDAVA